MKQFKLATPKPKRHLKPLQKLSALCALLMFGCGLATQALAQRLPTSYFVRGVESSGLSLSPDGSKIAFIYAKNHGHHPAIYDIASGQTQLIAELSDEFLASISWANDNRLLMLFDYFNFSSEMVAINADGSDPVNLFKNDGDETNVQFGHEILHMLPDDDKHLLIQYDTENTGHPDVYQVNIYNGKRKLIQKNSIQARYWVTNRAAEIRAAYYREGRERALYYRPSASGNFQEIAQYDVIDDPRFSLLGIMGESELLVSTQQHSDRAEIYRYDPQQKRLTEKLLSHPKLDLSGSVFFDPVNGGVAGILIPEDPPRMHFFQPQWRAHQDWLNSQRPDHQNMIIDISEDQNTMLVWSGDTRSPGSYYLYSQANDPKQRELKHLFNASPWIKAEKLAPINSVEYQARDGLTIPAYLTQALKPKKPGPQPTVLLVHGGPWARDYWGYNPEVQFLANRGYTVLQPQFRGSSGYGKSFMNAGHKEWGKAMQYDLEDAVAWLVEQGLSDPERICIMGASYGAYAAMNGVTLTPKLFQCAIADGGIYDLESFLKQDSEAWFYDMQVAMVGDPVRDQAKLRRYSPQNNLALLEVPVLIIHGDQDQRLPVDNARNLIAELKRLNKDHEYLEVLEGGHGTIRVSNRKRIYNSIDRFLKRNLRP